MASSRPYRFPALCEDEPARRTSARQSCGTCGAAAVANCVALCCCPCAVVSCFTLALVKAPYVAGRRWVRVAKTRRRKTKRVRNLDDQLDHVEGLGGGGQCNGTERASKESWGEPGGAAVPRWWSSTIDESVAREGRMRVSVTEKAWIEMYEVGHWGFGRLSFSVAGDAAAAQVVRSDPEEDGSSRAGAGR
ncbi:uncharacterized protein LOC124663443 [Lolium rigidum]|uniref:uncharacterized protein LOC124663443 n=1 Tax=Lolium rigidum TaxID=89674 RepID=UPI001F5DCF99|nr:uncharacterized protein LOC124663443 [Lolium rigidum]